MNAEQRLREWAQNLHFPGLNVWPSTNVLYRIKREGAGASHRTDEQSDGGMFAMVERMAGAIDQDRRCQEVAHALNGLSRGGGWRELIRVTYMTCSAREGPRSERAAAEILQWGRSRYRTSKRELLKWLAHMLDIETKEVV